MNFFHFLENIPSAGFLLQLFTLFKHCSKRVLFSECYYLIYILFIYYLYIIYIYSMNIR
jgi:hypothetical protein